MKPSSFLAAYSFFVMWIPECRGDCYPLVGTETNISCSDPKRSSGGLYWRVEVDGVVKTLVNCVLPGTCNSVDEDLYVASLDVSTSYLTIKQASRSHPFNMETRWFCTYLKDNYNQSACAPMVVRENPQNPRCGHVSLNTTSWELSLTCWTGRVYPQASCYMHLRKYQNDTFPTTTNTLTYVHTEVNETVVYYKTECTFEIRLEYLLSYGVFYEVSMHSNGTYFYYSSSSDGVYTDMREIKVDVTDHLVDEDGDYDKGKEDNTDEDKSIGLVIALGVALGVAVLVVVVLAVVVCRNSQRKKFEQTRERAKQKMEMAKQRREPRQANDTPVCKTQATTVSTSPENRYDRFNMNAQNEAYEEEDENYQVYKSAEASAEEEEEEVYENRL